VLNSRGRFTGFDIHSADWITFQRFLLTLFSTAPDPYICQIPARARRESTTFKLIGLP
jgi:hypothetical protein